MSKGTESTEIRQHLMNDILLTLLFIFIGVGSACGSINTISGQGSGELLLNFTIYSNASVISGTYNYDIVGINIPPISTPFNVTGSKKGYAFNLPSVFLPNKPNDFTVSASRVKNLYIGIKKDPVKAGINHTRTWVTTQIIANKEGMATTTSDLLSPGVYQVKIFGDAAENVTQVNLTMTLVKKIVVSGPFKLSINTTGFPSGNYSITAKALNGTFRLDGLAIGDVSIPD